MRGVWGLGLCAVGLVIGCGGKYQESAGAFAEAGTAGELNGAAGALIPGGAGTSGAGNVAGLGGTGAAGPIDPSCLGLVGVGVGVQVSPAPASFCRGQSGEVQITHASNLSDRRFNCCAVSDTSPKYSLVLGGSLGPNLDGSFALTVPLSAPLGKQNLNVTCAVGGPLERPITIQALGAPQVTSVSSAIHPTDTVRLEGVYLNDVTVNAVPTISSGPSQDCVPVSVDDHAIACKFSHITPGPYDLEFQNAGCPGGVLSLTVLEPD